MKIGEFKYIITNIGGGWTYTHIMYGVTPDGKVYSTKQFNENQLLIDLDIKLKFIGQLDKIELGLKLDITQAVMDASYLTLYEVNNTLEILHSAPEISSNNPQIYNDIQRLIASYSYLAETRQPFRDNEFVVGEVKTAEEFRSITSLISKGHKINTTYHASNCDNLVKQLREVLLN